MGCCGSGNSRRRKRGAIPNQKLCPNCGWIMNQVHSYNISRQAMLVYQQCTNKTCKFKKIVK